MKKSTFIPNSDAMIALGRAYASELKSGSVIALTGKLGAGKTHFVKGLAEGLRYTETVSSPTFTLVHEYIGGTFPLFHFDLYRLKDPEELISLGWDDFLDRDGIVIAEWADSFPDFFPESTRWIKIEQEGEGRLVTDFASAF